MLFICLFLISKFFLLLGYLAGNIPPIGNAEEKKNKNGQGIKASKHYNCHLLGNASFDMLCMQKLSALLILNA